MPLHHDATGDEPRVGGAGGGRGPVSARLDETAGRRRQWGAVALGLVLTALVLVAALGDRRPRLAASNSNVLVSGVALTVGPGQERCQGGEFVPGETARLRVYAGTFGRPAGEPLAVSILGDGGLPVSAGRVPGGYSAGAVDVAISSPSRELAEGRFCLRNEGQLPMAFAGNLTPASEEAQRGPEGPGAKRTDDIRVDYFRPGAETWWELAPTLAQRFWLFKASFFGTWTMWAVLAVVVLLWVAAIAVLVRRPPRVGSGDPGPRAGDGRPRSLPAVGWACAAIAVVNAGAWATITPPFQVPDEPVHAGYAQWLAETGSVPRVLTVSPKVPPVLSEEATAVGTALPFNVESDPSWSVQRDRALRRELDSGLSRTQESGAGGAARYPPLYYALEAVPARIGAPLDFLDRLFAMRLVSALLAGVTVAFVFLFLREVLPATPWAWAVGALAVAFQPVFGFLAGGVNNENLLYAAGAALLFLLARVFRRGVTPRTGVAIGAAAAVGTLTKPTMLALVAGAALALVLLVRRGGAVSDGGRAMRGALAAGAVFAAPTAAWFVADTLVFHHSLSSATGSTVLASAGVARQTSVPGQLSYLWQFFLPRLPFMPDKFSGYPEYPVWDVYVQGLIGRFGWFQFGFPLWVNQLGLGVLLAVSAAAASDMARARRALRRHAGELGCYAAMVVAVVLLVAVAGYRYRAAWGLNFEQPRYFFVFLALYGAVVALAARATGRRWGPAVGTFLVVLAMAHSLFAMLLAIGRYYA